MEHETRVFNCEKCKNEFPGLGSLKKDLRNHEFCLELMNSVSS